MSGRTAHRRTKSVKIYPWHTQLLSLLLRGAPLTTAEVADRLYRSAGAYRLEVARHELVELHRRGLVQRDGAGLRADDPRERWHPDLFAPAVLGRRVT